MCRKSEIVLGLQRINLPFRSFAKVLSGQDENEISEKGL